MSVPKSSTTDKCQRQGEQESTDSQDLDLPTIASFLESSLGSDAPYPMAERWNTLPTNDVQSPPSSVGFSHSNPTLERPMNDVSPTLRRFGNGSHSESDSLEVGSEPHALKVDGIQALFDRVENTVTMRRRQIDHIAQDLAARPLRSLPRPRLPITFAKHLADFLLADSDVSTLPVSTTPQTNDRGSLSGFVILAQQKVRSLKQLQIRWVEMAQGPDSEWLLLWYLVREISTDEHDRGEMVVERSSVQMLSTLAGSSVIDHGVDAISRDGRVVAHYFSIYPPPDVYQDSSIDFACLAAEDSARWVAALRTCTTFHTKVTPSATLYVFVHDVRLTLANAKQGKDKDTVSDRPFHTLSCLVKYDRFVARTCSSSKVQQYGYFCVFPIDYDDPDDFVHFEVYSGKNRKLVGSVSVPLDTFERNMLVPLTLKLRCLELMERGFMQEGTNVGEIHIEYRFEQPLLSLFLPLPRLRLRQERTAQRIKKIDRRLRNRTLEEHKHFNMLTARLLKHADAAKVVTNYFNRVVWWMSIPHTIAWLIALTSYVVYFYVYTLSLVVCGFLAVSIYRHPYWKQYVGWYDRLCGNVWQIPEEAPGSNVEVYEHQRRLAFGRWSAKRLYWWDPPAWVNCATSGSVKSLDAVGNGDSQYRWNVEVEAHTDENGWQYSSSFREGMWSSTFFIMTSVVRRRKHIATPSITPRKDAESSIAENKQDDKSAGLFSHVLDAAPHRELLEKLLVKLRVHERLWIYWLDFIERRKNLFAGTKSLVSTVMVVLLFTLLLASLIVPTRFLLLGYIYLYFSTGWSDGVYFRCIRDQMIQELKDEIVRRQLMAPERVARWNWSTPMKEVFGTIGVLALRDWLTNEYLFEVPVPLKSLHESRTLEDLAQFVINGSLKFIRRREKQRAWWKISFSAFIDHVASDLCSYEASSITFFKARDPTLP